MIPHVTWCRFLRLITRNRRVPADADLRARHGTWGWLMGQDIPERERAEKIQRYQAESLAALGESIEAAAAGDHELAFMAEETHLSFERDLADLSGRAAGTSPESRTPVPPITFAGPPAPDPQTDRRPDVSAPYPGMALDHAATLTAPWPAGVVARYLTVAWSTVDVLQEITPGSSPTWPAKHVISARCTGTGCPWYVDGRPFMVLPGQDQEDPEDYSEDLHQLTGYLYDTKRRAQGHAETCRAMRKP